MESKEEILEKACRDSSKPGNVLVVNYPVAALDLAMDQYAKQQSIAYAHWLFKKIFPYMTPDEPSKEDSEALYNQFLNSI